MMTRLFTLVTASTLCVLVLGHHVATAQEQEVRVTTPLGVLVGKQEDGIDQFLGIPFAQPPVPPARFQAPRPVQPWHGEWNATHYRHACVQMVPGPLTSIESEDCLYLNLFRPSNVTAYPMPVMAFIHGGAYAMGWNGGYPGNSIIHRSNEGVILVNLAYRLGSLGFFALPGLEQNFNAALLDQRAGLMWIQDNIASFGGDPNRVMLFGESAGGASVALQMAMPQSWKYFHRAVIESGGYTADPVSVGVQTSLDLANAAGCSNATNPNNVTAAQSKHILQCLQSVSVDKVKGFGGPVQGYYEIPMDVMTMWRQGLVNPVPTILGVNQLEGSFFVRYYLPNVTGQLTDQQYFGLMHFMIPSQYWDFATKLYQPLREKQGNRIAVSHAIGDFMFCGWFLAANGSQHSSSNWYQYVFTQPRITDGGEPGHFGEVPYVFGWIKDRFSSAQDVKVSFNMVNWWTSFAATGDPNCRATSSQFWPPYVPGGHEPTILSISSNATLLDRFDAFYCSAWMKKQYGMV